MKRERLQKDDLSQHREGEVANLKRQRQTLEQQLAAATSKADKMRKEKESAMQKMEGLREQLKANGSQVKSSSTPEVTNNILHITINAFYMRPLCSRLAHGCFGGGQQPCYNELGKMEFGVARFLEHRTYRFDEVH
ncbi:hypothetical protein PMIN01_10540 [Paraphaeosphaeria minitans]|uniref:Uncharacterized protein n=1 Tax=Paraphaeosphaeria minitans TaxID=565426 RepID=A0A9P6GA50_9PLEO|nr:hypothetical protein PMIN01_10540 [Paraphaeosphaeria minitans]